MPALAGTAGHSLRIGRDRHVADGLRGGDSAPASARRPRATCGALPAPDASPLVAPRPDVVERVMSRACARCRPARRCERTGRLPGAGKGRRPRERRGFVGSGVRGNGSGHASAGTAAATQAAGSHPDGPALFVPHAHARAAAPAVGRRRRIRRRRRPRDRARILRQRREPPRWAAYAPTKDRARQGPCPAKRRARPPAEARRLHESPRPGASDTDALERTGPRLRFRTRGPAPRRSPRSSPSSGQPAPSRMPVARIRARLRRWPAAASTGGSAGRSNPCHGRTRAY